MLRLRSRLWRFILRWVSFWTWWTALRCFGGFRFWTLLLWAVALRWSVLFAVRFWSIWLWGRIVILAWCACVLLLRRWVCRIAVNLYLVLICLFHFRRIYLDGFTLFVFNLNLTVLINFHFFTILISNFAVSTYFESCIGNCFICFRKSRCCFRNCCFFYACSLNCCCSLIHCITIVTTATWKHCCCCNHCRCNCNCHCSLNIISRFHMSFSFYVNLWRDTFYLPLYNIYTHSQSIFKIIFTRLHYFVTLL